MRGEIRRYKQSLKAGVNQLERRPVSKNTEVFLLSSLDVFCVLLLLRVVPPARDGEIIGTAHLFKAETYFDWIGQQHRKSEPRAG